MGAGVGRVLGPGGAAVAVAVVLVAHERTALLHLVRAGLGPLGVLVHDEGRVPEKVVPVKDVRLILGIVFMGRATRGPKLRKNY